LQLRFARHNIDACRKRAVSAVIGNLNGEINRYSEPDGGDVEQCQQSMSPDIPQHMPVKQARILCGHARFRIADCAERSKIMDAKTLPSSLTKSDKRQKKTGPVRTVSSIGRASDS
jgi:hypothetical protein